MTEFVNVILQVVSLTALSVSGYLTYESSRPTVIRDKRIVMNLRNNAYWKSEAEQIFKDAKIGGNILNHVQLTQVRLDKDNVSRWYWYGINTNVVYSVYDKPCVPKTDGVCASGSSTGTPHDQLLMVAKFIVSHGEPLKSKNQAVSRQKRIYT